MKTCDAAIRFLLFIALGVLTLVSESKAQDSLHQNHKNADFFEIESTKEKIASLIATGSITFSRQLSSDRFIVQSYSDFSQNRLKKVTGYEWKFLKKNWKPEAYSRFIIGFTNLELLKQNLNQKGVKFKIVNARERESIAVIQIESTRDQESVFQSTYVTSIDRADKMAHEETLVSYHDLSVNKVNPVHHKHLNYDGEGFGISIKELSFNSADIDFKGRYVESELASPSLSVHANFMATISAGGGNSASNSKGSAWKASVSSSDFSDPLKLFADDPVVLSQYGISVQNHSYGTTLESFYGDEAVSYDEDVFSNPTMLHVFSAGNSGLLTNEEGTYAGLTSYSTLTGNFKMAKNVLVVGGHYRDYTIDERNSRGPAYDGRIKPELVAFGEEGTSDASALATGVAVLIQDAYKTTSGAMPPVSLVKTSLMAGADDTGTIGIDYVTGYGAINAAKSIDIIESNQFAMDALADGASKIVAIEIPPNTTKATIALAWTDPPAETGDAFALVNDLDLYVTDPGNNVTLPWVLNATPQVDLLTAAPERNVDRLNNAEVVTLDNPAPGTYEIHVSAFQVVNGEQDFSVAWSFEEADSFTWTYPLADDVMEAGAEVYLRWDNTISGTGTIEKSVSDGAWELVASDVPLQNEYYVWQVPDINASVKLRINTGLSIIETDAFMVSKQLPLKVLYNCTTEGMIAWDKLPEATGYTVFKLGDKFLEPVATVTDTSFLIDKPTVLSDYFSVAPIVNGQPAFRSFAYNINEQGVNCYYTLFYGLPETGSAHLFLNLSILYNVKSVVFEKQTKTGFIPVHTFTSLTSTLEFLDTEIKPGITWYRASIELLSGEVVVTELASVMYADESTYMLWPNPVKAGEELTIFTDGNGDLSIYFFTVDGRKVEGLPIDGYFFRPKVQAILKPGMFYYQIFRNGNRVATGKLMVVN